MTGVRGGFSVLCRGGGKHSRAGRILPIKRARDPMALKHNSRFSDDRGFSIIESMMSLFVLALVITMVAVTVSSSLNHLRTTRVQAMASNLAQARVEDVRVLSYAEVGTVSGSPVGILPASETITVGGVDFAVAYVVAYEGSATGNDVIPGGGDGVPTGYNTGIDYKRVEITVTDAKGAMRNPIVMETIVAPPNAAAHDGLANIQLNLIPTSVPATTPALPGVCLMKYASVVRLGTPDAGGITFFPAVDPNGSTVGVDYEYSGRIGSLCSTEQGDWFVLQAAITSGDDAVHVNSGQTGTINLPISLKQELTVKAFLGDVNGVPIDSSGTPLSAVTCPSTWQHPTTSLCYDLSTAEPAEGMRLIVNVADEFVDGDGPDSKDGEWLLDQVGGDYLVAGSYDLQVELGGYSPVAVPAVLVPDVPTVWVVLPEATVPLTKTVKQCIEAYNAVEDRMYKLAGIEVDLTWDDGGPQVLSLVTDAKGCYELDLPETVTVTRTVQGERGFANPPLFVGSPDDLDDEPDLQLFPANGGVVLTVYDLDPDLNAWHWRWRERGSSWDVDPWVAADATDISEDQNSYTWAEALDAGHNRAQVRFSVRCGGGWWDIDGDSIGGNHNGSSWWDFNESLGFAYKSVVSCP